MSVVFHYRTRIQTNLRSCLAHCNTSPRTFECLRHTHARSLHAELAGGFLNHRIRLSIDPLYPIHMSISTTTYYLQSYLPSTWKRITVFTIFELRLNIRRSRIIIVHMRIIVCNITPSKWNRTVDVSGVECQLAGTALYIAHKLAMPTTFAYLHTRNESTRVYNERDGI